MEKHRLCVSVPKFKDELKTVYKLEAQSFVVIAVSKGCDFALPTLTGLPDWHDTLRLCAPHARRTSLFVNSDFDFGALLGVLRSAVVHHKRAKITPKLDKAHRANVEFAVMYWMTLDGQRG